MSPKIKKLFIILGIIAILSLVVFLIINNQHYFSRRAIRTNQRLINSFGSLAPLAALSLIVLSTLIPPLPLPIPLIEIASGLAFGFRAGFVLVWISQIISSILAFKTSKFFSNRFLGKILQNKFWNSYRSYIDQKGARAVFTMRATLGAPFNIVSFLAGLSQMDLKSFTLATILGTIPEALLFSLIGSELRNIHFRLWYLFIGIALFGVLGTCLTFINIRVLTKGSVKLKN